MDVLATKTSLEIFLKNCENLAYLILYEEFYSDSFVLVEVPLQFR